LIELFCYQKSINKTDYISCEKENLSTDVDDNQLAIEPAMEL